MLFESCLNSPPPRPAPPTPPRPPLRGISLPPLLFAHTQTIPHSLASLSASLQSCQTFHRVCSSFRSVLIAACNKSGRKFHEIRALFSERREVKIGREASTLTHSHDEESLSPVGGLLMYFAFPKIGFAICEGFVTGGEPHIGLEL